MIKRILVGIDTSEHSRTAQTYAFHLARRLGATLIGVHVVDIVSIEGSFFHDISGSLGLEPYLDFSTRMREILNARGKGVLEDFAQAAASARLSRPKLCSKWVWFPTSFANGPRQLTF